ncbi:MAG: C45 family peptidase [Myxococcales bacterium]|nr:C45 family peptidase [Myxococcales bacterium]
MDVIELCGAPRDMGTAFGEICREAISELYTLRLENALTQAELYGGHKVDELGLLQLAEQCLRAVRAYTPEGLEELEGVAAASGLTLAQVWMMNSLTDVRDVAAYGYKGSPSLAAVDGEACSSAVVPPPRSRTGQILTVQTWDLSTDNMPFVRVVRRVPTVGPATLAMTTVGCLSLIGLNECGLGVGTTNLRTTDTRVGIGYLDVIHKALGTSTFEGASRVIVDAPRAAAHYYYLVSEADRAQGFECSATQVQTIPIIEDVYVHCNHCLCPSLLGLEAQGTPMASSHHRQQRMTDLAQEVPRLDPIRLQAWCADMYGGDLAINRKNVDGISTNASVVMNPAERTLWFIHGPADLGSWFEYRLA